MVVIGSTNTNLNTDVGQLVELGEGVSFAPLHQHVTAVLQLAVVHDAHGAQDLVHHPVTHERLPGFVCSGEIRLFICLQIMT